MHPSVRRLITEPSSREQLLAIDPGTWGVFMDVVEETGSPAEAWLEVATEIAETNWLLNFPEHDRDRLAYRLLFRGLASSSYLYALQLFQVYTNSNLLAGFDTVRSVAAISGMNIAKCGENWESDLLHSQVEEILGEHGNLERKPLVYRDAHEVEPELGGALRVVVGERDFVSTSDERTHDLWLGFAPEWLGGEFDLHDGEYLTLITYGGGYQSAEPDFLMTHNRRGEGEVWEKIAEPAHGAEAECPFTNWDSVNNTDQRDGKVVLEETFCGEYPGRECRLCGERIGKEHRFIYIGEGATTVYRRIEEEDEEE